MEIFTFIVNWSGSALVQVRRDQFRIDFCSVTPCTRCEMCSRSAPSHSCVSSSPFPVLLVLLAIYAVPSRGFRLYSVVLCCWCSLCVKNLSLLRVSRVRSLLYCRYCLCCSFFLRNNNFLFWLDICVRRSLWVWQIPLVCVFRFRFLRIYRFRLPFSLIYAVYILLLVSSIFSVSLGLSAIAWLVYTIFGVGLCCWRLLCIWQLSRIYVIRFHFLGSSQFCLRFPLFLSFPKNCSVSTGKVESCLALRRNSITRWN